MAFNVTGLTAYVDENRGELLSAAVSGAKSSQVLSIQTGFKGSGAINILDTDVIFQADAAGRTPSGTTTLSQRILTVGAIKVEEDLDVKALNNFYIQHEIKAGSMDDEIPAEQAWAELKAAKIASALETAIWQSAIGGAGGANLDKFDGFLKIIDAEVANTVNGNPSGTTAVTGITIANIEGLMDDMYTSIPLQLLEKDDVSIFVGHDTFRKYTQALKNSNLFHYSGEGSQFEITIPATNVKVIALHGLNGTDRMVGGRASNFVVGVDLEHDEDVFEVWYSKDDKVVKFDAAFKYGCQVGFPSEIVDFKLV